MQALVVGCGLSGAVIARELAEQGYSVLVLEKRTHIGGNMYDHVDDNGILVHDYGPHTFHTTKKELFDYVCRFADWDEFYLTCGAEINGICTPTPFNFQTIDDFYAPEDADRLKEEIRKEFPGREQATVLEVLGSSNRIVREYAQFLFDNDYSLYSAKQWGVSPEEIDPTILKRVPLRFSYKTGYFDDKYQVMPHISYTAFFEKLLDQPGISVELNINALEKLQIRNEAIYFEGRMISCPIVYTGPLDELFDNRYGHLPYRSLRFEWKYEDIDSKQNMPVVAYPQEKDYIRIIEYKKLPMQEVKGSTYEIEYAVPYKPGQHYEPYYPLLTKESQNQYLLYRNAANAIPNLFVCGRLGDYKYYNMDQVLERALYVSKSVLDYLRSASYERKKI